MHRTAKDPIPVSFVDQVFEDSRRLVAVKASRILRPQCKAKVLAALDAAMTRRRGGEIPEASRASGI